MKIVINKCYGGFGLSTKAYEKLIEWGVPAVKYNENETILKENEETGQYDEVAEIIYDRELTPPGTDSFSDLYWRYKNDNRFADDGLHGRYWDSWSRDSRTHPLVVRVVEELGRAASNKLSHLEVIEIPDDVEWQIEEYDGIEWIAEKHRTWG